MNELVGADHGALVPYRGTGTQRLATMYRIDEARLEAAIERMIGMSDAAFAQLGTSEREVRRQQAGLTGRIEAALLAQAHAWGCCAASR